MEATDAGRGVGVTIVKVKYRDLEMARINGWTHLNRIHRAPHDSAQNEAERSNAAIGEALVDGGAVKWEYFKATDGLNQEQIKQLSVGDLKKLEEDAMQRNAWRVSQNIVERIDGEPGPAGDCMAAFVTSAKEDQFFFNSKYIQAYNSSKSAKMRDKVPGHNYFSKLDSISQTSVKSGEMYHEYRVDDSVPCTPRPFPDRSKLPEFHYLPPGKTPITQTNGDERDPDDYHPRAQLKKLYKEKIIASDDSAAVKCFSQSCILDEKLTTDYLCHLQHLDLMSEKRKKEKKAKTTQENQMVCEEFDWQKMLSDGTLQKQRVPILNKYIDRFNLVDARNKKKTQKLHAIVMHLHATANKHPCQPATAAENYPKHITDDEVEEEEEEEEEEQEQEQEGECDVESDNSSSDEDIVLEEIGDSTSEDSS